jgi:cation diffusion facilitator CzcD-associated flavoprotein CzcO
LEAQQVSVTQTCAEAHHVAVIGAGATGLRIGSELPETTDFVILERAPGRALPPALEGRLRADREVLCCVFDDGTDTWTLKTRGGNSCHARIVIAAHQPIAVPWIPDLAGRNDFRGPSFHAAAWDRDFDPAGKRVAVIGADATAGSYIGELAKSAASVIVFAHPPRRFIPRLPPPSTRAKRWLRRHAPGTRPAAGAQQRRMPELVKVTIEAVTASGIRTREGAHHGVDAIIYGTGFTIPNEIPDETLVGVRGVNIRQAWHDGMEPYYGVAVHGFPNYFLLTGPDIEAQTRYIVGCLALMNRAAATRIEVRRSSQQVFNERVHLRSPRHHVVRSAFDLSSGAGDDAAYDGAATLTIAGTSQVVRVRLTGYFDPIDGQYHWRGTVFDPLSAELLKKTRAVTLTIEHRSAEGRITEQTPWGSHSVAGVGAPPFEVPDTAAAAPILAEFR